MVEAYLDGIVQELIISPSVLSFKILNRESGDEEGYQRIKCLLQNSGILEFSEYVTVTRNKISVETYSYHWQDADGRLVKRWDNVPHHEEVDTFPHHIHLTENKVVGSSKVTLKKVLVEIEKTIIVHDE